MLVYELYVYIRLCIYFRLQLIAEIKIEKRSENILQEFI